MVTCTSPTLLLWPRLSNKISFKPFYEWWYLNLQLLHLLDSFKNRTDFACVSWTLIIFFYSFSVLCWLLQSCHREDDGDSKEQELKSFEVTFFLLLKLLLFIVAALYHKPTCKVDIHQYIWSTMKLHLTFFLGIPGERIGEAKAVVPAGQASSSWSFRDGPADHQCQQR